MLAHGFGEGVVNFPTEAKTLLRIDGVKEKERRDRENLHIHILSAHILQSALDAVDLLGLEGDVAVIAAVGYQTGALLSDAQTIGTPIATLYLTDALMRHVMRMNVDLQSRILSAKLRLAK